MRLSVRFSLILAILVLTGISCMAVTRLMGEETPAPQQGSGGELAFKPEQLPEAQAGVEYSARVTVEGTRTPVGAFILNEGELPPGLELQEVVGEENTAVVSGTPTRAGTYKFVLYVWCYGTQVSGQTGQKEYTITVNP